MLRRFTAPILAIALIAACTTPVAPLSVSSLVPADGATDVAIDVVLSATFSRAIDPASLTGSFTLANGGGAVAGVVAYDAATLTATFTPEADLAYATTYTATVAGSVSTADGVSLAGDASWSFTTADEPDPEPAIGGIDLDPDVASLTVGDTVDLEVVFSGVVGSPDLGVTWTSSDEDVATVDDGLVTAVAVGSATITATSDFDDTLTATAAITVVPVPDIGGLEIDPDEATLILGVDDDVQLEAVFSGVVGSPDLGVTWASSDEGVATVDDGLVTAVAVGSATITATSDFDDTLTATAAITVWSELLGSDYDDGATIVDTALAPLAPDVAGGTGSYTYALSAGALPAGVTLDTDTGVIAGTPTVVGVGAGAFTGTVTVSDGVQEFDLDFSIQVADVMTVNATIDVTEDAGTPVSVAIIVTGGLAPFSFEVTDPADPAYPEPFQDYVAPGLTLNADGTITGTLDTAGFWRSFVTTTDALGQTGETMLEIITNLVLIYAGTPYDYPLGCGGDVFAGSVACPAGDEPLGTQGANSAITPVDSIIVLGSGGGPLTFSWTLLTPDVSNNRWAMSPARGVVFRRNNGTNNNGATHNSNRTYEISVYDDNTGETATAIVQFNVITP